MGNSSDDPRPSTAWGVPEELSSATKKCDQTVIARTPELDRWVNDNIVSAIDPQDLSKLRNQFRKYREDREAEQVDRESRD